MPGPDRPNSRLGGCLLLLVVGAIALAAGIIVARSLHRAAVRTVASPTPARRHLRPPSVVVFLVDGLSYGAWQRNGMPHLRTMAGTGTSYSTAWLGQYESTALASAAAIGTGLLPGHDGVVGDQWSTPGGVQPVSPPVTGVIGVDSLLSTIKRSAAGKPIASAGAHARPVLAVGGTNCSVPAAATGGNGAVLCFVQQGSEWMATAVPGHGLPAGSLPLTRFNHPAASGSASGPAADGWKLGSEDDAITQLSIAAMRATHPALTIIDFPEYGQVIGASPSVQRPALQATLLSRLDADIARIARARQRAGERTAYIFTSLDPLAPVVQIVSRSAVGNVVVTAGTAASYLAFGGSAALGLDDSDIAQHVGSLLAQERLSGVDAVFTSDARGREHLLFLDPLLSVSYAHALSALISTVSGPNAPAVIAVYGPGYGTRAAGVSVGPVALGLQWPSQHVPLLLWGQGVASKVRSTVPARLVDLPPTVDALLGLRPPISDGVVLADGLASPPAGTADAQQRAALRLIPAVTALQARLTIG